MLRNKGLNIPILFEDFFDNIGTYKEKSWSDS